MSVAKLCQPIEVILCDVDGVLTDGGIIYDNEGVESKRFNIRDGLGIKLWQNGGGKFGVITSRNSHIVHLRASELGVKIVRQGTEEKLAVMREILAQLGVGLEKTCYIGDDLPDLAAIKAAGLGVAVADAAPELLKAADFVTKLPGGAGAVRETIETILKAQHRWDDLIRKFAT